MKKVITFSCILVSALVIGVCWRLPSILTKIEKKEVLTYHPLEEINYKLSNEENDDSFVVRIWKSYEMLRARDGLAEQRIPIEENKKALFAELQKLVTQGILLSLEEETIEEKTIEKETIEELGDIYLCTTIQDKEDSLYRFILWQVGNQNVSIVLDKESEKIIWIEIVGEGNYRLNTDTQEVAQKFISYLELDTSEPWDYNGILYQSSRFKLVVKAELVKERELQSLSVIPESGLKEPFYLNR